MMNKFLILSIFLLFSGCTIKTKITKGFQPFDSNEVQSKGSLILFRLYYQDRNKPWFSDENDVIAGFDEIRVMELKDDGTPVAVPPEDYRLFRKQSLFGIELKYPERIYFLHFVNLSHISSGFRSLGFFKFRKYPLDPSMSYSSIPITGRSGELIWLGLHNFKAMDSTEGDPLNAVETKYYGLFIPVTSTVEKKISISNDHSVLKKSKPEIQKFMGIENGIDSKNLEKTALKQFISSFDTNDWSQKAEIRIRELDKE
ncbi:MAG: hypothetical protein JJT78_15420 [Leptospira sp.]|nr:hypothetical protein [Leptospira sp.]